MKIFPILLMSLIISISMFSLSSSAEVVIVHLGQNDSGFGDWYAEMAEQFEQETGIKVELNLSNSGEVAEKLVLMVLSGMPPDTVGVALNHIHGFDVTHTFVDLSIFFGRDGVSESEYPPAVMESLRLENGGLFGIPFSIWTYGAAYNKTMFSQLGLADPTEDWTWDDLAQYVEKAAADTTGDGHIDRYGWNLPATWTRWQPLVVQAGGNFLDRRVAPTRSTLLSPEVRNAFEFIGHLSSRGAVATDWSSFSQGNAAISYDAGTNMSMIVGDLFEMAWLPYAKGPTGKNGGEITPLFHSILQSSPHQDAAWMWIKYISHHYEAQMRMAQITERIPGLLTAARDYFAEQSNKNPSVLYLLDQIQNPDSYTRYAEWTELMSILESWMRRALVDREIPVYEALLQADSIINAQLQQNPTP